MQPRMDDDGANQGFYEDNDFTLYDTFPEERTKIGLVRQEIPVGYEVDLRRDGQMVVKVDGLMFLFKDMSALKFTSPVFLQRTLRVNSTSVGSYKGFENHFGNQCKNTAEIFVASIGDGSLKLVVTYSSKKNFSYIDLVNKISEIWRDMIMSRFDKSSEMRKNLRQTLDKLIRIHDQRDWNEAGPLWIQSLEDANEKFQPIFGGSRMKKVAIKWFFVWSKVGHDVPREKFVPPVGRLVPEKVLDFTLHTAMDIYLENRTIFALTSTAWNVLGKPKSIYRSGMVPGVGNIRWKYNDERHCYLTIYTREFHRPHRDTFGVLHKYEFLRRMTQLFALQCDRMFAADSRGQQKAGAKGPQYNRAVKAGELTAAIRAVVEDMSETIPIRIEVVEKPYDLLRSGIWFSCGDAAVEDAGFQAVLNKMIDRAADFISQKVLSVPNGFVSLETRPYMQKVSHWVDVFTRTLDRLIPKAYADAEEGTYGMPRPESLITFYELGDLQCAFIIMQYLLSGIPFHNDKVMKHCSVSKSEMAIFRGDPQSWPFRNIILVDTVEEVEICSNMRVSSVISNYPKHVEYRIATPLQQLLYAISRIKALPSLTRANLRNANRIIKARIAPWFVCLLLRVNTFVSHDREAILVDNLYHDDVFETTRFHSSYDYDFLTFDDWLLSLERGSEPKWNLIRNVLKYMKACPRIRADRQWNWFLQSVSLFLVKRQAPLILLVRQDTSHYSIVVPNFPFFGASSKYLAPYANVYASAASVLRGKICGNFRIEKLPHIRSYFKRFIELCPKLSDKENEQMSFLPLCKLVLRDVFSHRFDSAEIRLPNAVIRCVETHTSFGEKRHSENAKLRGTKVLWNEEGLQEDLELISADGSVSLTAVTRDASILDENNAPKARSSSKRVRFQLPPVSYHDSSDCDSGSPLQVQLELPVQVDNNLILPEGNAYFVEEPQEVVMVTSVDLNEANSDVSDEMTLLDPQRPVGFLSTTLDDAQTCDNRLHLHLPQPPLGEEQCYIPPAPAETKGPEEGKSDENASCNAVDLNQSIVDVSGQFTFRHLPELFDFPLPLDYPLPEPDPSALAFFDEVMGHLEKFWDAPGGREPSYPHEVQHDGQELSANGPRTSGLSESTIRIDPRHRANRRMERLPTSMESDLPKFIRQRKEFDHDEELVMYEYVVDNAAFDLASKRAFWTKRCEQPIFKGRSGHSLHNHWVGMTRKKNRMKILAGELKEKRNSRQSDGVSKPESRQNFCKCLATKAA